MIEWQSNRGVVICIYIDRHVYIKIDRLIDK